jgi:hypothetical protein
MRVDVHSWPGWVLDLLHINVDQIPRDAEALVTLRRFPESGWGLLALLALGLGIGYVFWIYRREASLSPWRKAVFASLRALVVAALALALFAPVLEVSVEHRQRAVTLVFVDDSLSFGIADAYALDAARRKAAASAAGVAEADLKSTTRAAIARSLLADPRTRVLARLAEKNLLRVFSFSDGPRSVSAPSSGDGGDEGRTEAPKDGGSSDDATDDAGARAPADVFALPEIPPRGAVTDLGLAVRSTVEGAAGTPIAAIVVLSDGKITAGEDGSSLGLFLAEKKIPFHAVAIGDPSPTRNIRVQAVSAPERVFQNDPLAVDVSVDQRGLEDQRVVVELLDLGDAGSGLTLASAEASFEASMEASVRFSVKLERLGKHRLAARVAPQEGETFEHDNQRAVDVEVVEQATRVLLVAGAPSNEFRILRNFLRRDVRTQLAAWLMSADADLPQEGNVVLKKLPSTARELFEYDVVILVDPAPEGFPPGFGELIESFVGKHRGGLAYVAGEKYAGKLLRAAEMKPLLDVLAVEPDFSALTEEFGRGRFHTKEWPLAPSGQALTHPASRLSAHPDSNRQRWAELPGVYWSLPVRRPKPGATVLLEHSDPRLASQGVRRPLLAYQFYEGGRSVFMGFDECWRWRSLSEEIYDQFWMQLVRSLSEGRLQGDRRNLVLTDRESYPLGEVVRVSALLRDENYRPSAAPSVEAEVLGAEGEAARLTLEKDPTQEGWFRGILMPSGVGRLRIRVSGAEKAIHVELPDVEYEDPRLDLQTLESIARLSGGSVIGADGFGALPDRIPDASQRVVKADEPRPLWDSALTLALVVALLTAEWILRKWSRLP